MIGPGHTRDSLILGVDLGTSSLKALAIDARGAIIASAMRAYPLHRPQPGWAEQDPNDWWHALLGAIAALQAAGVPLASIAAIGLSGQMHGLVLLDAHGAPTGPCHTWADTRCVAEAARIERRLGRQRLLQITGSLANTSATAAKLLWLRRHQPDRWRTSAHLLLPKDYLRFRLTGVLATDPSDASGTLLCDLATRDWSPDLLAALHLPHALLPPIVESPTIAGALTPDAASATGLTAGIPVIAGGGDTECAAVGMGLVGGDRDTGTALATLGTAGQLFVTVDHPQIDPSARMQTLCHAAPGRWHMMGAILSGASSLDWLASTLGAPGHPIPLSVLLTEAAAEPPGAHNLLFLPHLNGTRLPDMNPHASGVFIGLRPEHTRASLARAVVEGVALALREGLEIAAELHIPIHRVRLAGGANRHPLWARIQSDVFGLPVELGTTEDASALGAALLATVGIGLYLSLETAIAHLASPSTTIIQPDPTAAARYAALAPIARDLTTRLHTPYAALASLP